jgi:hypothetical protein
MSRMYRRRRRFPLLLLLLALGAAAPAAAACFTVRLAAQYDAQVDQAATQLQRSLDAFLTRLEGMPRSDPEGSYEAQKGFYLQYGVDLRALKVRAASLERNSITVQQIESIESSLERLRRTHESQNRLSAAAIQEFRNLFNTAWTAVLAYELAKRR